MREQRLSELWIGIDTGGTFTDVVALDPATGKEWSVKEPTTPEDPSIGILRALDRCLLKVKSKTGDIALLVHGTTLATNAILQGNWAKAGMITTAGFSDILDLARQRRPNFFNLDVPKPLPPIPTQLRYEVAERLGPDGSTEIPLDVDAVARAALALRENGVESIVIAFLHAYANSAHEALAEEAVRKVWPQAFVTKSAELTPEFREYERFATASINACLTPILTRYLELFEEGLIKQGVSAPLQVMQSNGGAASAATVRNRPIDTFFSGPAGGVIGATELVASESRNTLVTFDMGGTSTDVCLVREGTPGYTSQREMAGFPVRTRTIDMHTIGAGGGSIAWVDPGGLLKVGPQSSGASPGPAAYGYGGTLPTVTDANVVLGRLNPTSLLNGAMPVYAKKAQNALQKIAKPLGMSVEEAAAGVVQIVDVNMMGAVRVITIERGQDPRRAALVPFGGAGPLHAAAVAEMLGMAEVVIPTSPGVLSAWGLIAANARGDFAQTLLIPLENQSIKEINSALTNLMTSANSWSTKEGLVSTHIQCLAELRYLGQSYELAVPISDAILATTSFNEEAIFALKAAFTKQHKIVYGHAMEERSIEVVTLRLSIFSPRSRITQPEENIKIKRNLEPISERPVWFESTGFVRAPVYNRSKLFPGAEFNGPAIVEQMDATVVVPPGFAATVEAHSLLILKRSLA